MGESGNKSKAALLGAIGAEPPPSADKLFDVKFPVKFTYLLVLLVSGLAGVYYWISQDYEKTFIFFGATSAAAGAILSAFYTGRMLHSTILYNEQKREEESERHKKLLELEAERVLQMKKEGAASVAERWNDPNLLEVRKFFRELVENKHEGAEKINARIKEKKDEAVLLMNFLEDMAIRVKFKVIDEELARANFGGILLTIWQLAREWVDAHRVERNRPLIWKAVQDLYDEWCKN